MGGSLRRYSYKLRISWVSFLLKEIYSWIGCGITAGILAWVMHSLVDTGWSSFQLKCIVVVIDRDRAELEDR